MPVYRRVPGPYVGRQPFGGRQAARTSAAGSHDTSGAIAADAATVAGTAAHLTLHTTTGVISAGSATVTGSADHTTSGTTHTTTGVIAAQASAVAGAATHLTLHTTSGALAAQAATVAGTATHLGLHTTTGVIAAGSATVVGAGTHLTLHTTTGAIVAQAATVNGTGDTGSPPVVEEPGGGWEPFIRQYHARAKQLEQQRAQQLATEQRRAEELKAERAELASKKAVVGIDETAASLKAIVRKERTLDKEMARLERETQQIDARIAQLLADISIEEEDVLLLAVALA